jgi:hypothetical protein
MDSSNAKSGNVWTEDDLDAFRIEVRREDAVTFFGRNDFPLPALPVDQLEELLTVENVRDMNTVKNRQLVYSIDISTSPDEEGTIDFAWTLLNFLGYTDRDLYVRSRVILPLLMRGEWVKTQPHVCLVDHAQRDSIILIVQGDKSHEEEQDYYYDPETQLLVEAVAAFEFNNSLRKEIDLAPLEYTVCP